MKSKCIECKNELGHNNKSGYCYKCYHKSPQYREYQRKKQKEWESVPENKKKKIAYRNNPENKKKRTIYYRKWRKKQNANKI